MSEQNQIHYTLDESEKTTLCMAYLPMKLVWGDLLSKKGIRVATWLKMQLVPDYFTFYNAQVLIFGGAKPIRLAFPELHIPTSGTLAYHLLPPATSEFEIDYDLDEPNRKMEPVAVLVNIFRFDGWRRISSLGNFAASLAVGKETFVPLYDVTISHPTVPSMKSIQVPYTLFRQDAGLYMLEG